MRPSCPDCHLPLRTCLCALARRVEHRVPVVVLQHPREAGQAKGSVRLLARCLRGCKVQVGLDFPPDPAWLQGGTALLYPGGDLLLETPQRLLVLDGSWRESRLLLHRNPWLLALPRYRLRSPPPSQYGALRKAHAPEQLSTLEAVAAALSCIEQTPALAQDLKAAMAQWLALQARHRSAARPGGG